MQTFKLEARITIRETTNGYGSGLTIAHECDIEAADFMEMCRILGQFDELAKKFQKK